MIDLLKEEKQIIKEENAYAFSSKKILIDSAFFAGSTIGFLVSDAISQPVINDIFLGTTLIYGGKTVYDILSTNTDRVNNIESRMHEILSDTESYERLSELYFEFICALRELMHSLGITKSAEMCKLYTKLLNEGVLSVNGFNNPKSYAYIKGDIPELRGAKVLTGNVCSYESAGLLSNVLNSVEVDSGVVITKIRNIKLPYTIGYAGPFAMEKAITGVVDRNFRYSYDQELGLYLEKDKKNPLIEKPIDKEYEGYYYLDENQYDINVDMIDELPAYKGRKIEVIQKIDDEYNTNMINRLYEENKSAFLTFRMRNLRIMQEIVRISEYMSPRSDKKILQWSIN